MEMNDNQGYSCDQECEQLFQARISAVLLWGSTVNSIDALIGHKTGYFPKNTEERVQKMNVLTTNPEIDDIERREMIEIQDTFLTQRDVLHERCFYIGACDVNEILKQQDKTREIIEKVQQIVGIEPVAFSSSKNNLTNI